MMNFVIIPRQLLPRVMVSRPAARSPDHPHCSRYLPGRQHQSDSLIGVGTSTSLRRTMASLQRPREQPLILTQPFGNRLLSGGALRSSFPPAISRAASSRMRLFGGSLLGGGTPAAAFLSSASRAASPNSAAFLGNCLLSGSTLRCVLLLNSLTRDLPSCGCSAAAFSLQPRERPSLMRLSRPQPAQRRRAPPQPFPEQPREQPCKQPPR